LRNLGSINCGSFLKSTALRFKTKEAVFDADKCISRTFSELDARANSLANGLLEAGIRKGDFVAVLLTNCVEFVELYYALSRIGAIIAPQPNRLTPAEIKELVNLSGARVFIFSDDFVDTVETIRGDLPTVKLYIGLGRRSPDYAFSYEKFATSYPTTAPPVEVEEEDPYYLNFTSGTTNVPKAYLLNHYNITVASLLLFDMFDVTSDDTFLTVFPMYGRVAFGWTGTCLFKGARNVVLNFTPDRVLEVIQEQKVTLVNLFPIMAQMMMVYAQPEQYDLSSLRGVVFAGSALPENVYEETRKRLCENVYEFYGLQETGIITTATPEMKRSKPSSVGLPPVGVTMRLVDSEGNDVPAGETGEVIMQGPAATTGYFNQPEINEQVLRGGWFHTGDLGICDEDGALYIVGRNKDMIVSGGQNIFAPEVEETLLSHPAVADCAVIGLPHELWGEQVAAIVVLEGGEEVRHEDLIAYCKEKMASFKAPKIVRFRESLPRNLTLKVQKFLLVEEYSQDLPA
jgi:fatty-acyl-CoA synthase